MATREGIMLAYPYDEKRLNKYFKQGGYAYVQKKIEGDRCRAVIENNRCTLFSSSGAERTSVPHINLMIESMGLNDIELDGELYIHGWPHEDIRSIVSRTVIRHPRYDQMGYYIFDVINDQIQSERVSKLNLIRDSLQAHGIIHIVPSYKIITLEHLDNYYQEFLNEGYEGIIIRSCENRYIRKRSTGLMKLKPRLSGEYKIIGFEEEYTIHNEPKNTLGALWLQDEFETNSFKVGTGFTHEMRKEVWENRDKYLGKMAKIRYQSITDANTVPKMASFEQFLI